MNLNTIITLPIEQLKDIVKDLKTAFLMGEYDLSKIMSREFILKKNILITKEAAGDEILFTFVFGVIFNFLLTLWGLVIKFSPAIIKQKPLAIESSLGFFGLSFKSLLHIFKIK